MLDKHKLGVKITISNEGKVRHDSDPSLKGKTVKTIGQKPVQKWSQFYLKGTREGCTAHRVKGLTGQLLIKRRGVQWGTVSSNFRKEKQETHRRGQSKKNQWGEALCCRVEATSYVSSRRRGRGVCNRSRPVRTEKERWDLNYSTKMANKKHKVLSVERHERRHIGKSGYCKQSTDASIHLEQICQQQEKGRWKRLCILWKTIYKFIKLI